MATFRKAVRFLRSNASASLMFLIYILMWWMPLRPIMTMVSGRSDIPYGINGPLEWMSRWWLSEDAPTLFQPIALIGAWLLASQRLRTIRATWARTCRSAARRGAKWASYSWMPLAVLLFIGAVSFLGHITPLAITTLVWLPIGVVFYIYGPRVIRSLHTPILLLIAATAVPDTIPELLQKFTQRILGAVAILMGRALGDTLTYDAGSAFNVADDYLRTANLNAPIAAPMNGLALMASTIVIAAIWTLHKRRGIASTAFAKLVAFAIASTFVLAHTLLIVIALHNGHRGYGVASLHNVLLLPLTAAISMLVLNKCFTGQVGQRLRSFDRAIVLWFVSLPDIRRKNPTQRRTTSQKATKPVPPLLGVLIRMTFSPFRTYWQLMTRIDTKLAKWESASARNKRSRR
jgi:hypothetical protein